MALEGSLQDFDLADILQLIHQQKKTGVLIMKNLEKEVRILFEGGLVVATEGPGTDGLKSIGEALLAAGKISKEILDKLNITLSNTAKTIVSALAETGAVTKEDLLKFLNRNMKESVLGLFKWREGQYRFEPSDVSYEREYTTPVSTEFLIIEGVRRADEWPIIEQRIPDPAIVFEKKEESPSNLRVIDGTDDLSDEGSKKLENSDELQVTQEEMAVYSLVDGSRDVRRIIEMAGVGEFETSKALGNLVSAGLISARTSFESAPVIEESEPTDQLSAETPILVTEEKPRERFALPVPSSRQLLNGGIIGLLVLVMILSMILSRNEIKPLQTLESLFRQMEIYNQIDGVRFAVITYYYANGYLPDSIDALVKDHYISEDTANALENDGIRYIPDNEVGEFRLARPGMNSQ